MNNILTYIFFLFVELGINFDHIVEKVSVHDDLILHPQSMSIIEATILVVRCGGAICRQCRGHWVLVIGEGEGDVDMVQADGNCMKQGRQTRQISGGGLRI